jgi:sugar/nucleoside kinase (ribokinase family)
MSAIGMPIPAPQSPGRFSAGSGDCFLGGLIAALDRGAGAATALDRARDAAERNAACPGPGVLGSA